MSWADRIKREPVLISVLVGNLLGLAAAFGLNLSTEQSAGLMAVLTTVLVIAFGRANVYPSSIVAVSIDDADGYVAADALAQSNGTPVSVSTRR